MTFLSIVLTFGDLHAHGSLHEQITEISRKIARATNDPALYLRRADLHRLHGDFSKAELDLKRSATLEPDTFGLHWVRGHLELDQHQYKAAMVSFTRCTNLKPGSNAAPALVLRSQARAASGDSPGAIEDLNQALELVPNPPSAPELYLERARLLLQVSPPDRLAALAGIQSGIRHLGSLPVLEVQAAEIEASLGQLDSALIRLDRLAARASRKELWRVKSAELLDAAGRRQEAAEQWKAAWTACQQLPAKIRSTPAQRSLESRIRSALGDGATPPIASPGRQSNPAEVSQVPAEVPIPYRSNRQSPQPTRKSL